MSRRREAMRLGVAFVLLMCSTGAASAQSGSWPIGAGGSSGAEGQYTAVDDNANLYVAGTFRGTTSFGGQQLFAAGGTDVFVAKYDAFGGLIWAVSAGGAQDDEVGGIAVDESQNAYVTGAFRGTATIGGIPLSGGGSAGAIFVAKLDVEGDWQWARKAGDGNGDAGRAIWVNGHGVFVGGKLVSATTFANAVPPSVSLDGDAGGGFVAALDEDGLWRWAEAIGNSSAEVEALVVDDSGRLYVAGSFGSAFTVQDIGVLLTPEADSAPDSFVAKLNAGAGVPDPSWGWAMSMPGPIAVYAIAVDDFQNLYLAGEIGESDAPPVVFGPSSLTDVGAFVARLHDNGGSYSPHWAIATDGGVATSVGVEPDGGVLLTGYFGDSGLQVQEIGLPEEDTGRQAVVTGRGTISDLVVDVVNGFFFWIEGQSIWRSGLDGSGITEIVDPAQPPTRIAVDRGNGRIYWTSTTGDHIRRAALDGTGAELVQSSNFDLTEIAVDEVSGQLFWIESGDRVNRSSLDGGPVVQVVFGSDLDYFAIDVVNAKIYYRSDNVSQEGELRRDDFDGGSNELLSTDQPAFGAGHLVDSIGGRLYWFEGARIWRSTLEAAQIVEALNTGASIRAFDVDSTTQRAYWASDDSGSDSIFTEPLSASVALRHPFGLAFDSAGNLLATSDTPQAVLRYEGASGDFAFLDKFVDVADTQQGAQPLYQPHAIEFGLDGTLYVASRDNYGQSPGGEVDYLVSYQGPPGGQTPVQIPATGATNNDERIFEPEYLAVEPAGTLFVSESHLGVRTWDAGGLTCGNGLPRQCLTGGGLDDPRGLAFGSDELLYVASHDTDAILRFDPDTGVFVDEFVSAGASPLDAPTAITFDALGDLYVGSDVTRDVLRFDGATGAFVEVYISSGEGMIQSLGELEFGPDGALYAADPSSEVVRRYTFAQAPSQMVAGAETLTSAGGKDVFVGRLEGGGAGVEPSWSWVRSAGGTENDVAASVIVAAPGVYYITGAFSGTSTFGELELEAGPGPMSVFVARLECEGDWARLHTWVSGEPLTPPSCFASGIPEIEIPGMSLADATRHFFWSPEDSALYAVRPVDSAFVKWKVSDNPLDDARIVQNGLIGWPNDPQLHIAGAPVSLEPAATTLTYNQILYETNDASDAQKAFSATEAGFGVLLYSGGVDPAAYHHLEVVETVRWDDPEYRVDALATIGVEVFDSDHDDPSGLNGYVLATGDPGAPVASAFDGVGGDRAYSRSQRSGPIIPVNENDRAGEDLVVAWYAGNSIGVVWPVKPVHYDIQWPADPPRIIIASELGSELPGQPLLDPVAFPSMRVYHQPSQSDPGFNPNDEHALLVPSNAGSGKQALFALRSDLDVASQPYSLLKYFDETAGQWAIAVYRVEATGPGFDSLSYAGTAGTIVAPPYPIRLLGDCAETFTSDSVPFWQDYRGTVWARAAGDLTVHYFYPLQFDFYYDVDVDGEPEGVAADCVPWLDRLPNGTPEVPFPVNYTIAWPAAVPTLLVGETLTTPKRGLPDILNQAAVEIAFDELSPDAPSPDTSLGQLIDPLSPRSVSLAALPSDVSSENDRGKRRIVGNSAGTSRLSAALRERLLFDPLNELLSFEGIYDASGAGEPLLLLNVMTEAERDALLALSNDTDYEDSVRALYRLTRNPRGLDLDDDGEADRALLVGLQGVSFDEDGDPIPESARLVGISAALSAGQAAGEGYLTLAFNNDATLSPLPVSLSIIRVGCAGTGTCSQSTGLACSWDGECPASETCELSVGPAPYQGEVKVIESENLFDEQLTLRHSGDFLGEPKNFSFEWFYHPDDDGTPPPPPTPTQPGGWIPLPSPPQPPEGLVELTIEGASLQSVSDNWYFSRYTGYPVCENTTTPSGWAGAPGGSLTAPVAQLGEGWIKRVVRGLNPFEARVDDFHGSATNTYGSMIVQLGERYEGDVALNSDPDALNQVGLIEAYETVLRRGLSLTTMGTPPVDYGPANNQLLLVASRIADFYMLLGNEAFADAADPTIGLGTDSSLGSLAPTIFTFQNQLDSLLGEELTLLRGRDDSGAPTGASPVYNRLFWNFTSGEGEIAYSQAYGISDETSDGFIDEFDARVLFPQGHGDAWGHYLTAIKTYYRLLRDPFYTWVPRAESVSVAGVPVLVDFLDERKFAAAAAARARTGAQVVDLTYRREYIEDPSGQWQGYKDGDEERAWGVDEWARRAGQGAYLDWIAANAIVPAVDPDFEPASDHPIQKVDRTTVRELREIPSHYDEIQAQVDEADSGLNPLGLAKGVVPFDIDPSLVESGQTHFDQIFDRARAAMDNALRVFDHANSLSQALRRNQDSVTDLANNASEQERDFRNRLIEAFGYPYEDDIGPNGTYPSGYDGPDLYHYMYVDPSALTGGSVPVPGVTSESFDAHFVEIPGVGFEVLRDLILGPMTAGVGATKVVEYEFSLDGSGIFTKPAAWRSVRRAPGELQLAISAALQNRARFESAIEQHDNLLLRIEDAVDLLEARYALNASEIRLQRTEAGVIAGLNVTIVAAKAAAGALKLVAGFLPKTGKDLAECLPKTVGVASDVTAPARCAIRTVFTTTGGLLKGGALVSEGVANGAAAAKEAASAGFAIKLETERNEFEILEKVKELEQMMRSEAVLRLEMYTQEEILRQSLGQYQATLARGMRVLDGLVAFRKAAAADTQTHRYRDMAFRIFRNDALQKYQAQLDMAARYAYLAATAYDYETNLLGSSGGAGRRFLTDIVRHRSLGEVLQGEPVAGSRGLADPLARMRQNFEVLRGQLGFNNPQTETNRFSLRSELFRLTDESDAAWKRELERHRVDDLFQIPAFRRLARPFAPESLGPQPGIVIPFSTNVTFGLNFFGWPLGGGDSAYDPSHFATKVRSAGVWFEGYDGAGLSNTPRVYLLPAGSDILRSPNATNFETREWRVVDQKLPVPFPIGSTDLSDPDWIPLHDSLNEELGGIRQISSLRAYHDSGSFDPSETTSDSRLIGRSVANTQWLLVVPGGTLLSDSEEGLETFIHGREIPDSGGLRDGSGISDIRLFFQTYSFSGN